MVGSLSERNRNRLIRAVQAGVPFVERPFLRMGELLDLSEEAVLGGLGELHETEILREISAVLEGGVLSHDSALVTGMVPKDKLESTARVVSAHPTVTHNYLRNHAYNLWFTIAVPPEMSLETTLDLLSAEAGVDGFRALRRTHTFKIGVNFDPDSLKNRTAATLTSSTAPESIEVGEREARLFRALQTPLAFVHRPFDELARKAEVTGDELIAFANQHLGGAIRRYVGTLRHRKLGVRENGMVVWRVSPGEMEDAGRKLASAPEVSHCYAREAIDGFPYTLYSMVHGPSRESCRELADAFSRTTGLDEYEVLFSEREFKKVRLRYFLPELDRWWQERTSK